MIVDKISEGLSYKQKKELKEKAAAGSSHNWNTLFLGQNAVADAIAKTYNATKENVTIFFTYFVLQLTRIRYKNFC